MDFMEMITTELFVNMKITSIILWPAFLYIVWSVGLIVIGKLKGYSHWIKCVGMVALFLIFVGILYVTLLFSTYFFLIPTILGGLFLHIILEVIRMNIVAGRWEKKTLAIISSLIMVLALLVIMNTIKVIIILVMVISLYHLYKNVIQKSSRNIGRVIRISIAVCIIILSLVILMTLKISYYTGCGTCGGRVDNEFEWNYTPQVKPSKDFCSLAGCSTTTRTFYFNKVGG